jgi:hypothetical protein
MAHDFKNSWYVVVEVPRAAMGSERRIPRGTKTFPSETEAKEFARIQYASGLKINAGTINPHLPKRAIAGTEIHRWLEGSA